MKILRVGRGYINKLLMNAVVTKQKYHHLTVLYDYASLNFIAFFSLFITVYDDTTTVSGYL